MVSSRLIVVLILGWVKGRLTVMSVVFCSALKFFFSVETAPAEMHDAPGTKTRGAQGNKQGISSVQNAYCLLRTSGKRSLSLQKLHFVWAGPQWRYSISEWLFTMIKSCIHRYVLSWWKSWIYEVSLRDCFNKKGLQVSCRDSSLVPVGREWLWCLAEVPNHPVGPDIIYITNILICVKWN